jgi:hypothetical protein
MMSSSVPTVSRGFQFVFVAAFFAATLVAMAARGQQAQQARPESAEASSSSTEGATETPVRQSDSEAQAMLEEEANDGEDPLPAEVAADESVLPETNAVDQAGSGEVPTPPLPATVDSDGLALEMNAELSGDALARPTEPPLPNHDAFDWIRFDSGEWLGGDLKEMRDRRVTFDSDKMDLFTEDWEDVVEFRSSRQYLYVNTELESFEGPGLVTQDEVSVRTTSGIKTFPRSRLLSIVATSSREIDRWSLKLTLAATARAGNSDTVDFNNFLQIRRQDRLTRGTLESTANLGNVNGQRTVQNWNGTVKEDVFFHRYFYFTPVFGSGQHNYFQNLRFRGALGGGGGVHAVDKSWLSVDFDALFAYQYTEYMSALPMQTLSFDDAVVGLGTSIEWDITDDIDLDLDWRSFLVVTEMGRTYHNGSARFSLEITDIFDFDLTGALYRIEEPVADENGVVPVSNDWTFTAGIGIELN